MKTIRFCIPLLAFLLCGLWSCSGNKNPEPDPPRESFIECYQFISQFNASYWSNVHAINILPWGRSICCGNSEFANIANAFNDNSYHTRASSPVVRASPPGPSAIATKIYAIDIVSDSDFSAELPAGISLGGVVKICAISAYQYIQSGYSDEFDWENNRPEEFVKLGLAGHHYWSGYHPVVKFLSEVTAEDLILLNDYYFYLMFTEIPTVKTHQMTVTLRIEGQELSTVVDVNFDDLES